MATRIPVVRRGNVLEPANQEALDAIRELAPGQTLAADLVMLRNGQLHRKAFAYVKLAFEHWSPANFLTAAETATVNKLGKFLADRGIDREAVQTLCDEFLGHLNNARRGLEVERDIDSFRELITVEAGHYRTVITPAGPRRIAKSWAYKNMSQVEFQRLFSDIRDTCWRLILNQTFASIEDADAVAEQLMQFD